MLASGAGCGAAIATEAYTGKLVTLMRQLENDAIPPNVAVQNFWAQLTPPEQARFRAEFPQFMHYVSAAATPGAASNPDDMRTLRVYGMPPTMSAEDLALQFSIHGQLRGTSVQRPRPPSGAGPLQQQQLPRIGFVEFNSAQDAARARAALDGQVISGSPITVEQGPITLESEG